MPITDDLKQIIATRVRLYSQPVRSVRTGEIIYEEILSRFHRNGVDEPPSDWIPYLEKFALMDAFDIHVLSKVIEHIKTNTDKSSPTYAVNISGQTINTSSTFGRFIAGIKPPELQRQIIFEITETTALEATALVRSTLQLILNSQYQLAIDDFGQGAFTTWSLRDLSPAIVKIDGSYAKWLPDTASQEQVDTVRSWLQSQFVRPLTPPRELIGCFFIAAIAQMAHSVGCYVVLEHVEKEVERTWAEILGVDYIQGWLTGKPTPLSNL